MLFSPKDIEKLLHRDCHLFNGLRKKCSTLFGRLFQMRNLNLNFVSSWLPLRFSWSPSSSSSTSPSSNPPSSPSPLPSPSPGQSSPCQQDCSYNSYKLTISHSLQGIFNRFIWQRKIYVQDLPVPFSLCLLFVQTFFIYFIFSCIIFLLSLFACSFLFVYLVILYYIFIIARLFLFLCIYSISSLH